MILNNNELQSGSLLILKWDDDDPQVIHCHKHIPQHLYKLIGHTDTLSAENIQKSLTRANTSKSAYLHATLRPS